MKNDRTLKMYKQYVCPNCFRKLTECTCRDNIPETLIYIDEGIQKHISLLIRKGWYTGTCCEGHVENPNGAYIYIGFMPRGDIAELLNDYPLPNGFKYDQRHMVLSCRINRKIEKSKAEEIRQEKLAELYKWIESIPNPKAKK